ncbi:hypothetical protein PROFUN_08137 [Planoprotostelium fungivorum]|uniref:Wax synthase domain-containing protein n=1 Tax=Planoprotostelium fungivorum TaxID=1890364 RepID=A0A2P6MQG5_9EUKA|nr:hypothetical protein PROFUN_08137 [Planoprotostelium fungivorum]
MVLLQITGGVLTAAGCFFSLYQGLKTLVNEGDRSQRILWSTLTCLFSALNCLVFPPLSPHIHVATNLIFSYVALKVLDLLIFRQTPPKFLVNKEYKTVSELSPSQKKDYLWSIFFEMRYESFDICTVIRTKEPPPKKVRSIATAAIVLFINYFIQRPELDLLWVGHIVQTILQAGHELLSTPTTAPLFNGYIIEFTSVSELWTTQWHQLLTSPFQSIAYRPVAPYLGRAGAVVSVFNLSGIWHGFWTYPVMGLRAAIIFWGFMVGLGVASVVDYGVVKKYGGKNMRWAFSGIVILILGHIIVNEARMGLKETIGLILPAQHRLNTLSLVKQLSEGVMSSQGPFQQLVSLVGRWEDQNRKGSALLQQLSEQTAFINKQPAPSEAIGGSTPFTATEDEQPASFNAFEVEKTLSKLREVHLQLNSVADDMEKFRDSLYHRLTLPLQMASDPQHQSLLDHWDFIIRVTSMFCREFVVKEGILKDVNMCTPSDVLMTYNVIWKSQAYVDVGVMEIYKRFIEVEEMV